MYTTAKFHKIFAVFCSEFLTLSTFLDIHFLHYKQPEYRRSERIFMRSNCTLIFTPHVFYQSKTH